MGERRRILKSALGVIACIASLILGWELMASGGFVLGLGLSSGLLSLADLPDLFDALVEHLMTLPRSVWLLARFSARQDEGWVWLWLSVPAAWLLLSGSVGRLIGGGKGHPYRGAILGIWAGVVLGALLIGALFGWLLSM